MSFFFDLMHAELQGFEDPPGEDSPPPVQSEDSLELSATLEQPCAVMPKEFPELEWDTDLCIPPQADPPILPMKLPDQDSSRRAHTTCAIMVLPCVMVTASILRSKKRKISLESIFTLMGIPEGNRCTFR